MDTVITLNLEDPEVIRYVAAAIASADGFNYLTTATMHQKVYADFAKAALGGIHEYLQSKGAL